MLGAQTPAPGFWPSSWSAEQAAAAGREINELKVSERSGLNSTRKLHKPCFIVISTAHKMLQYLLNLVSQCEVEFMNTAAARFV